MGWHFRTGNQMNRKMCTFLVYGQVVLHSLPLTWWLWHTTYCSITSVVQAESKHVGQHFIWSSWSISWSRGSVYSWLLSMLQGKQAFFIDHSYKYLNAFQMLMGTRSTEASSDREGSCKSVRGMFGKRVGAVCIWRRMMWPVMQCRKNYMQKKVKCAFREE